MCTRFVNVKRTRARAPPRLFVRQRQLLADAREEMSATLRALDRQLAELDVSLKLQGPQRS